MDRGKVEETSVVKGETIRRDANVLKRVASQSKKYSATDLQSWISTKGIQSRAQLTELVKGAGAGTGADTDTPKASSPSKRKSRSGASSGPSPKKKAKRKKKKRKKKKRKKRPDPTPPNPNSNPNPNPNSTAHPSMSGAATTSGARETPAEAPDGDCQHQQTHPPAHSRVPPAGCTVGNRRTTVLLAFGDKNARDHKRVAALKERYTKSGKRFVTVNKIAGSPSNTDHITLDFTGPRAFETLPYELVNPTVELVIFDFVWFQQGAVGTAYGPAWDQKIEKYFAQCPTLRMMLFPGTENSNLLGLERTTMCGPLVQLIQLQTRDQMELNPLYQSVVNIDDDADLRQMVVAHHALCSTMWVAVRAAAEGEHSTATCAQQLREYASWGRPGAQDFATANTVTPHFRVGNAGCGAKLEAAAAHYINNTTGRLRNGEALSTGGQQVIVRDNSGNVADRHAAIVKAILAYEITTRPAELREFAVGNAITLVGPPRPHAQHIHTDLLSGVQGLIYLGQKVPVAEIAQDVEKLIWGQTDIPSQWLELCRGLAKVT